MSCSSLRLWLRLQFGGGKKSLSGCETLKREGPVTTAKLTLCNDLEMRPHPCSMTRDIAATSSLYSATSLSELFAFLLQQKRHVIMAPAHVVTQA